MESLSIFWKGPSPCCPSFSYLNLSYFWDTFKWLPVNFMSNPKVSFQYCFFLSMLKYMILLTIFVIHSTNTYWVSSINPRNVDKIQHFLSRNSNLTGKRGNKQFKIEHIKYLKWLDLFIIFIFLFPITWKGCSFIHPSPLPFEVRLWHVFCCGQENVKGHNVSVSGRRL